MNATASSSNLTAIGSLLNIFVDPGKTFDDVRGHNNWLWYPLLLTLASALAVFIWYYATADWNAVIQQTMDYLANRNYSNDQLEQIRNNLSRTGLIVQTCIGITLVFAVLYLLQALYLFLAAKIGGYEVQGFGSWFSFTVWAYVPTVLGNLALAVMFLISGKGASLVSLDITALNTLIFKLPVTDKWFGILNTLHLTTFWTFALLAIGFGRWTKQSLGKSAAITLAPHILIYGIWVLVKLI